MNSFPKMFFFPAELGSLTLIRSKSLTLSIGLLFFFSTKVSILDIGTSTAYNSALYTVLIDNPVFNDIDATSKFLKKKRKLILFTTLSH